MGLEVNVETNPLDVIPNGEVFTVIEGQLRIFSPINIDGTLEIEGTLIVE